MLVKFGQREGDSKRMLLQKWIFFVEKSFLKWYYEN